MIGYLKGTILQKGNVFILIVLNGVGYRVEVGRDVLGLEKGKEVELYIHTNVSQDDIRLIGFDSFEKLNLFQLLIGISGIGPRAGLNIMSTLSIEQIHEALIAKDPTVFKKVSGIGKKNAERIILELANQLPAMESDEKRETDNQLTIALQSLGYQAADIEYVRGKIADGPINVQVKEALKLLAR